MTRGWVMRWSVFCFDIGYRFRKRRYQHLCQPERSAASVLRFIWRTNRNGELSVPLAGRIERLLLCDLTGLESTPASAAWSAAFDELLANSEAKLPTEFAG